MKKIISFLIFVFLLAVCGCEFFSDSDFTGENHANQRFSGLKDLTKADCGDSKDVALKSVSGQYKVLVLTDIHVGAYFYHESNTQKFYQWLDSYSAKNEVRFCLSLGDFANDAKEGQMADYAQIVNQIESKWNIRVYNVIGNHDLYSDDGFEIWKKYCYPHTSYYKFETEKFAWYALDSGSGTLGSKQRSDFKQKLTTEPKTSVIFTHYPLVNEKYDAKSMPFAMRDTTERNILIKLISESKAPAYICGHYHSGNIDRYGNFIQFNLKSFGEYAKWYIMNVDENAKSVSIEEYGA